MFKTIRKWQQLVVEAQPHPQVVGEEQQLVPPDVEAVQQPVDVEAVEPLLHPSRKTTRGTSQRGSPFKYP